MQAIVTKFHGPGNTRGSRFTAKAWGGSISLSYDHRLSADKNSAATAMALAKKQGWSGLFICGGMPDGQGRVYVWTCDSVAVAPFGIDGDDWFFIPANEEEI